MIALAAADGSEALVAECYGDDVGWLPWKRPGFELGLALRDFQRRLPDARGAVLEGHGMICWADTSEECEALSLDLIARAEQFLAERDVDAAFGAVRDGFTALPDDERRRRAGRSRPDRSRGRRIGAPDGRRVQRRAGGARLPGPRGGAASGRPGHVVPRSLPPHQGATAVSRPAGDGDVRRAAGAPRGAARAVPRRLPAPTTTPTPRRPRRRCAAPIRSSSSCRVSGCGASAPTRRRRGSPASSTSTRST